MGECQWRQSDAITMPRDNDAERLGVNPATIAENTAMEYCEMYYDNQRRRKVLQETEVGQLTERPHIEHLEQPLDGIEDGTTMKMQS